MQIYFNVTLDNKKYDCMLGSSYYPFSEVYEDAVYLICRKLVNDEYYRVAEEFEGKGHKFHNADNELVAKITESGYKMTVEYVHNMWDF